ncbi:MAG: glycosyltransferase [Pirellulales bacterium]|nr:glycosyltransferase [Pirellulales bacterium]
MQTNPVISLVIPAWNEAELLPRLLDSVDTASSRFSGGSRCIEVIVADNDSSDGTAEVARARGCVVATVTKRCIAAVRNGGAAVARGEFLAFADADFRIHPKTFNYIVQLMSCSAYVGGGTGLVMERSSLGIRATLCLVLPPLLLMGLDGGVWFCRRSDFRAIGGYNEQVRVGEDVRFLLALRQLGRQRQPRERLATRFAARKLGLQPVHAINSSREFDQYGDWHMLCDALVQLSSVLLLSAGAQNRPPGGA